MLPDHQPHSRWSTLMEQIKQGSQGESVSTSPWRCCPCERLSGVNAGCDKAQTELSDVHLC